MIALCETVKVWRYGGLFDWWSALASGSTTSHGLRRADFREPQRSVKRERERGRERERSLTLVSLPPYSGASAAALSIIENGLSSFSAY